jgi:hypothetical protein
MRLVSLVKITLGGLTYPPPGLSMSILVIAPRLILASASAPDPPPPIN